MKKSVAVFVIATLLINAMAPALVHAATYLQGAEVNADMLVQDAYVVVTYYDSKNKQKLEKGWICAIDETTFEIRSRALFGKKIIAYDRVLSVMMSEESTTPIKQINEVDRFMRDIKKQKARVLETEEAAIQRLNQKTFTTRPFRVRVYVPSIQKGQFDGSVSPQRGDQFYIEPTAVFAYFR